MSLKAKFWARRLELEPHGYILSLEGWILSLEARFWVSRLNLRFGGGDGGEEGGGKISPMCESIGHRPLRGRCPKG